MSIQKLVSKCCGAESKRSLPGYIGDITAPLFCDKCGKPCDPVHIEDYEVLESISKSVPEGWEANFEIIIGPSSLLNDMQSTKESIKAFISKIEKKAYERGLNENIKGSRNRKLYE